MTGSSESLAMQLFFHPDASEWVARWADCLELVESSKPPVAQSAIFLWADREHLELRSTSQPGPGAWIDTALLRRRAQQASELLKACRPRPGVRILDAMGGWGVDGILLAMRGAQVVMTERVACMHALEEDLVRRSGVTGVTTLFCDGFSLLDPAQSFDTVYLDPMFSERGKRALPGKRMQILAELTARCGGSDDRPLESWIDAARAAARDRLVVKRRLRDPLLVPPDWQILGRTVRYDVYRGKAD